MAAEALLNIEVVYAGPEKQEVIPLTVPCGATVGQAVERAGLMEDYGGNPAELKLGIFGRVVPAETVLSDGDRVEIYRPLVADPKSARRLRATREP